MRYRKYNNNSCACRRKHIHQSRFEARYCDDLDALERAGEIQGYETQVSYDLKCNGKHITRHIVDFLVTTINGKREVHEVKGFATAVWPIKRKLFEANFTDIPYIVIKKRKNEWLKFQ